MKTIRPIFFLGALYELLRTGILLILTVIFLTPEIDQVKILLFVLLASPGFIIFAGYLFLGLQPDRYAGTAKLLAVGKAAGILPVIYAALNSVGILKFASAEQQLTSTGLLFGIIILFDLLFFLFLVSYKKQTNGSGGKRLKDEPEHAEQDLPEMEEVELEE